MPASVTITTGERFGKLVAVVYAGVRNHHRLWKCLCDCGNTALARASALRYGQRTSCGCIKIKHRMSKSPEYLAWQDMRRRCCDSTIKNFGDYGGRGIRVCKEWENNFSAFYECVGARPSPLHSIERCDNNGDYKPGNVKWATRYEQVRNRRSNINLTLNSRTCCASDWAKILGCKPSALFARKKRGWSDVKILTTPVRGSSTL